MSNPWGKKNPWLSLWLSGANTLIGHSRAAWAREAGRQNEAFMRASRKGMADFWLGSGRTGKKRKR